MHPLLLAVCCVIGGAVHTPTGSPIAHAHLVFEGPKTATTETDAKGAFSIVAPPGRYDLTVYAQGFATVTVETGDISGDSRIDVALAPLSVPVGSQQTSS